jgi:xanthine dehydrogenase accessory factor
MDIDLLANLNTERTARRFVIVITEMHTGEQRLVREHDIAKDALSDLLNEQKRQGKSAYVEWNEKSYFIELHQPKLNLAVIGAVHISQLLAPVAVTLGYRVTIVDPRKAFATAERFPNITILAEWPDQALPNLLLDRWTALVALTHDPKIDDPAIATALKANCFYIGALGSRKTHERRLERLAALGFNAEQLARIHGPVGLAIGAASPSEIAISILAEVIKTRRDVSHLS